MRYNQHIVIFLHKGSPGVRLCARACIGASDSGAHPGARTSTGPGRSKIGIEKLRVSEVTVHSHVS